MCSALITEVSQGAPAYREGIRKGDILLAINGRKLHDILDYLFLSSGTRCELQVKRGGRLMKFSIRKKEEDILGLGFDSDLFDGIRKCRNKCPFCFVDQVPEGLRETLKVKDDDYRLSFLHGNFISLTNLSCHDWQKVKEYRLSPLYVSVHATNPDLRRSIFCNKNAADIMNILRSLTEWGISIHTQVVLCPGINDGAELERTVAELSSFYPTVESIAIVPVGVTRYLPPQSPVKSLSLDSMRSLIARAKEWQRDFRRRHGTPLVYLGDEFYVKTGEPIPAARDYGDFPQIENGVGMLRNLITEFNRGKRHIAPPAATAPVISIVTGRSAYPHISRIARSFVEKGHSIRVHLVTNTFWGEEVNVTGLLTGRDIIDTLRQEGAGSTVIIPTVSLRDDRLFLDDLTLEDIERETGSRAVAIEPSFGALRRAVMHDLCAPVTDKNRRKP